MADEVAWICVASIPFMVDGARAGLEWAVIVDDNLIHTKDAECSCYPARTRYPLVCGLEAGFGSVIFTRCRLCRDLFFKSLLCDYTAGHSDRDCVFPTTSSLKPGARLEGVDANIVAVIFDPALLYKVSTCCEKNGTASAPGKLVEVKG